LGRNVNSPVYHSFGAYLEPYSTVFVLNNPEKSNFLSQQIQKSAIPRACALILLLHTAQRPFAYCMPSENSLNTVYQTWGGYPLLCWTYVVPTAVSFMIISIIPVLHFVKQTNHTLRGDGVGVRDGGVIEH